MPSSNAYQKFLGSLSMSETLMDIEKNSYSNPPRVNEQIAVQGLRGGAVVLMVASFEFYLRELVIEKLDAIGGPVDRVLFQDLPDAMKITSVFESLNLAMKGPRHQAAPPKLQRLTDIEDSCRDIIAGNIALEAFTDTGSNPGPRVVRAMFKNLGIPDVFATIKAKFQTKRRWGGPVATTFIRDKLDEIVGHRHVVAHTASTLDLTRSQLRESIKFLKVLGEVLEWALNKHMNELKANAAQP